MCELFIRIRQQECVTPQKSEQFESETQEMPEMLFVSLEFQKRDVQWRSRLATLGPVEYHLSLYFYVMAVESRRICRRYLVPRDFSPIGTA